MSGNKTGMTQTAPYLCYRCGHPIENGSCPRCAPRNNPIIHLRTGCAECAVEAQHLTEIRASKVAASTAGPIKIGTLFNPTHLSKDQWEQLELKTIQRYGTTWSKHFAWLPTKTWDGWIWLSAYWMLPLVPIGIALKKEKPYV